MSRAVFFLPEAEAELLEAQAWYDGRVSGLGDRFFAAVDTLLPRISSTPRQFPAVHGEIHRALVRRFPYALYFRVEPEGVYVIACAHTSRPPHNGSDAHKAPHRSCIASCARRDRGESR